MKFRDWLEKKGMPQNEVAALLEISVSHMSDIVRDTKPPGGKLARKIELLTDGAVTLRDWYPDVAIPTQEVEEQVNG